MAQIKINITDFKIEGYELTKVQGTELFTLNFTVGLYDPNDKLITTVQFSSEGMLGHKFFATSEINEKSRSLLTSIDELISDNFIRLREGLDNERN